MYAKCRIEQELITEYPARETMLRPTVHVGLNILNVWAYNSASASTGGLFSIGNTVIAGSSQTIIIGQP